MGIARLFIKRPRPADAIQVAQQIFHSESAVCTHCAQCCRGTKSIGIHRKEPQHDEIVGKAIEQGAETYSASDGTAIISPVKSCVFLKEVQGTGITNLRICGIQQTKPWACTMYPFRLQEIRTTDGNVGNVVALIASCPPVAELLASGVNWLEPRECVSYEEREFGDGNKYPTVVYHVPILGQSLWPLIRFGNDGHSILAVMSGRSEINKFFLRDERGRSIIPIMEASPLDRMI